MRLLRAQVSISELYAKAGRDTIRTTREAAADRAVGARKHEARGVARIRGTEPPTDGGTRRAMIVLDFAISCGVIGVLRLFARLVRVRVGNASENLIFREEESVIRCRRDRARGCAVSRVVRILGNGLEDGTERRR